MQKQLWYLIRTTWLRGSEVLQLEYVTSLTMILWAEINLIFSYIQIKLLNVSHITSYTVENMNENENGFQKHTYIHPS